LGKGEILENLGAGKYKVKLLYSGRDKLQEKIDAMDTRIAAIQDLIDAEEDPFQLQILTMQKQSLIKARQHLLNSFGDDPEVDIWCVELVDDLTVGLTVATIEIPGERQQVNIRPAFADLAAWVKSRDGQLRPAIGVGPWTSLFNQMLFPAWQKYEPNYRIGQIVSIDHASSTCQVSILPAASSEQNLNVNQGAGTVLGGSTTYYQTSGYQDPGWDDFKLRYPSHPLVTNTEQPEKLPSSPEIYAQIKAINREVNESHTYETDASYRKVGDYWDIMGEGEKGDCEDFALTKADKLISDLGLSPRNMQIALCFTRGGDYHAVLIVTTTDHGDLVLDNNPAFYTKAVYDKLGLLRWDKFLINGDEWAIDSREAYTVPIEYMDCGGSVFAVGDNVVVEFTDRDWYDPKVIGFLTNPKECGDFLYCMFGARQPDFWGNHHFAFNLSSKEVTVPSLPPARNYRRNAGSAVSGSSILIFGGWYSVTVANEGQGPPGVPFITSFYRLNRVDLFTAGAWEQKTDLPGLGRSGSAGFTLDGKSYVVGGDTSYAPSIHASYNPVSSNYELDYSADAWAQKTSAPGSMFMCKGHQLGGKGYVFGDGYYERFDSFGYQVTYWTVGKKSLYVYDAVLDDWETKQSMAHGQAFGTQFSTDAACYSLGWVCDDNHPDANQFDPDRTFCDALQKYDPVGDAWSLKKDLHTFEYRFSFYDPAHDYRTYVTATVVNTSLTKSGGLGSKGYIIPRMSSNNGVIEYDEVTDTYSAFFYNEEPTPVNGNIHEIQDMVARVA
jgi:predicted transglutaminase-like cysteine proteinase